MFFVGKIYYRFKSRENRSVSSVCLSEEPETAVKYRLPVERSSHISNARDCTYIPPVRLNHPRIVDTEARYYQAHPPQLSPPQSREVTNRS